MQLVIYFLMRSHLMSDKNAPRSSSAARASLRTVVGAVFACALGAAPAANALPVIPQGVGFGIDTPAGRGGQVYRVTNLNTSGAGSLRACIDATGPRVCVFEVSGEIRITSDLAITKPNITIAGQTAPSPGIMLRGAALRISTSDVLIQHIRVRVGDDPAGPEIRNRDALKIESPLERPIKNIVVDHCSFSWATDETVALWNAWDNVTLSNNIISEGLHWQPVEGHLSGYGILLGSNDGAGVPPGRAAIIGNLLAHTRDRNPLNRGHHMVFANNVVHNRKTTGVDLSSSGASTNNTIIGNVFTRGPDTRDSHSPVTVRVNDDKYALPASSKVYVADNAAPEEVAGDAWSVVTATPGSLPSSIKSLLPVTWPVGLTRLTTDNNLVLNHVLKFAGARPADRDTVDSRVVKSVRNLEGHIIACVKPDGTERCSKNAGGWPVMARHTRPLVLPTDHNEVTSSGYTKLELWLHKMAAEVEGRSAIMPAAPILAGDR